MKNDSGQFDSRQVFKRLLSYLFKHKLLVLFAIMGMILTALSEASFAAMIEKIVNDGFVQADEWYLKWLALVLMSVMIFRAIAGYFAHYFMAKVGRHVIFDIRQDMFNNLITLPTTYFDSNSSSKNVSKLIYDVEATSTATTDTLTALFKDSVVCIALFSWMLYLDWRLTLIFLLTIPSLYYVTKYSNKRFQRTSKEIQNSMGGIADTVKEASIGQKVIKVFAGQQQEVENFNVANSFNFRQNIKRARVSSAIVPITMVCIAPAVALILHIYLNYLRTGPEAAGEFTSYFTACIMLMSPLKKLAKINEKIQIGITAANSVFAMIDAVSEKDYGTISVKRTQGNLIFDKVSFAYQNNSEGKNHDHTQDSTQDNAQRSDNSAILKDLSFTIKPGERVALVGPSGSGKSTITALILRFYRASKGKISLDGYPLNDLILKDLRNQVALVSQETTLFDDTIRRNIMYGMLDQQDEQRLQEVTRIAHVDEFVHDLPEGLDTVVGEHGLRLSGGQRQRIAIARAIYKDAPFLILDEATSALDNQSERLVQDALEKLMENRTSLVIAHRLSTIESADKILVLENGCLVEQGAHDKLLKQDGLYANLHRAQSRDKKRKGFFSFKKRS